MQRTIQILTRLDLLEDLTRQYSSASCIEATHLSLQIFKSSACSQLCEHCDTGLIDWPAGWPRQRWKTGAATGEPSETPGASVQQTQWAPSPLSSEDRARRSSLLGSSPRPIGPLLSSNLATFSAPRRRTWLGHLHPAAPGAAGKWLGSCQELYLHVVSHRYYTCIASHDNTLHCIYYIVSINGSIVCPWTCLKYYMHKCM